MSRVHVLQLIISLDFGGAETLAASICRGLDRSAFRASICGLFGGRGPLAEFAERDGTGVHYLDAGRKGKLRVLVDLWRLLRELRVDIVQIHGCYPLLYAFVPAMLAGVRVVYTEHSWQYHMKKPRLWFAAKYFSRFVDAIVCVSEELSRFFQQTLRSNPKRIAVVHNGVDTSRFDPALVRAPEREDRGEVRVGSVARLVDAKDHDNLLGAMAAVVEQCPRARLLLVGDGERKEHILETIAALKLEDRVTMLGSRDDIPELLASMDIFVLSSKSEGFPISILEAMAMGKPVVATDVGGVAEVITHGRDGLIVPPRDHLRLARGIIDLVEDRNLFDAIASRSRERIVQEFSQAAMVRKYEGIYRNITGIA